MQFAYLGVLLFSLAGMVIIDHRWKTAFFRDARKATLLSAGCVAALLCWDSLGIATGAFVRGDSPYMVGVDLAPQLPLEEPVFLFFLTYLTMNLTGLLRA